MRPLALLVGSFIILAGVAGVFAPDRLLAIGQYSVTAAGLYVAAVLRICIGLVLVLAAPASRAPTALRVFGAIAFVGGLATPLVGVDRARAILEWSAAQGPGLIRLCAGLALVLGGFITYAVAAERRPA